MLYGLGVLIAIGAAGAFAAVGILTIWGGYEAVRRELVRGFVVNPPSPAERVISLSVTVVPLAVVALFSLMAAGRITLMVLGIN